MPLDKTEASHRHRAVIGAELLRGEEHVSLRLAEFAHSGGRIVAVTATLGDSRQSVKKRTTNGESGGNVNFCVCVAARGNASC